LQPGTGERAWLDAVRLLVPSLAAAFRPDIVVSQHGADSHAFDPLAHLRVTTTAMGEAARIVDAVAHRWAGGRWLATGGGGYDAYRVVPRSWSLVWLAGAHRDVPSQTPEAWRERWADEAARYGQAPLPETFDDPPNAGFPFDASQGPPRSCPVKRREPYRLRSCPRSFARRSAEDGGIPLTGRIRQTLPSPPALRPSTRDWTATCVSRWGLPLFPSRPSAPDQATGSA
jgi:hypothetical protein